MSWIIGSSVPIFVSDILKFTIKKMTNTMNLWIGDEKHENGMGYALNKGQFNDGTAAIDWQVMKQEDTVTVQFRFDTITIKIERERGREHLQRVFDLPANRQFM